MCRCDDLCERDTSHNNSLYSKDVPLSNMHNKKQFIASSFVSLIAEDKSVRVIVSEAKMLIKGNADTMDNNA